ncbi:MAG: hypothetical protein AAGM67_04705, partial [Bacteroidota bacterium]
MQQLFCRSAKRQTSIESRILIGMRLIILMLLCCSFIATSLHAQSPDGSPYQFHRKRDLGGTLSVGLLDLTGHLLQRQLSPLSDLQLSQLDPSQVHPFDRGTIGNWSPRAATLSDVLLGAALITPFALPLVNRSLREARTDLWIMGLQTLVYTDLATTWTKYSVRRVRPFAYLPANNDQRLFQMQR